MTYVVHFVYVLCAITEEMAEQFRRCQRRRGMVSSGQRTGDEYKNQRRRSRAVLYHLSGQFEKQNRAKSKLQQFNKVGIIVNQVFQRKTLVIKIMNVILQIWPISQSPFDIIY